MKQEEYTYYQNFISRTDLEKYTDNALLLYTLQLKYGIEDIDEVASTSLVDGRDDKKTDLLYINTDLNEAVIAQGFFAQKDRAEAPANKASDLNTSVSWLLTRDIDDLPDRIKSASIELRNAIADNEIKRITLWYSHNLPESQNVRDELLSAERTLSSILNDHYPEKEIETHSLEVGLESIEDWYLGLTIPIMMTETITLENCFGFNSTGDSWVSFTTSFPATILYDLYNEHGTTLFSANVRDYLGSRRSDSNINNGIKTSAVNEPNNFFIFNNGITALVNEFEDNEDNKILSIKGLSIVNGAQTTGAIASLENSPTDNMLVPIRLIKCEDPKTVESVVRYNNSQNKITAPDFRSNDQYQKRLTTEFSELGNIEYSSRRGGSADIISRNPNLLPSITAGQVLAAFHNAPSVAYNEKSKIWSSDRLYSKFFHDQTTAKHIFLCYSLIKSIEDLKLYLIDNADKLIDEQENTLQFLRSRGSIILLATSISDCMENILNKKIPNKFAITFCDNLTLDEAKNEWSTVINIASSFVEHLNQGLKDGIKNKEKISAARITFTQLMSAVRNANSEKIDLFAEKICL